MSTAAATPGRHRGVARDVPRAAQRSIYRRADKVAALMAAEIRGATNGVAGLNAPLYPEGRPAAEQVRHPSEHKASTGTETPDVTIKMIATPAEESGAGEVPAWQRGGIRRRDDGDDGAPGAGTNLSA